MYRISRKLPPLISLICILFTFITLAQAQKSPGNSSGVAPVIVLDSSKEQDGLIGPVRRVQTEIAKLDTKAGVVTEGARQLLEVTTYNLKGERVDNVSYPVAGPAGTEEYKYDDKGNIVEMTLRGADGSIISREIYKYETDGVGNWTKMTTSLILFEDGAIRYEPVEATYRTIAYFYDEKIAKVLENRPSSTSATKPASIVSNPDNAPTKTPTKPATSSSLEPNRSALTALREEKHPTTAPSQPDTTKKETEAPNRTKPVEVAMGARASAESNLRPTSTSTSKEAPSLPNAHKAALDLYKTGREQFGLGNLPSAIQSYQQAIELEPGFADVYLSLGHAYLRLQKSKEAIKAFKEATRLNPEMEEAHYGLGLEYFRTGNMKDAAQSFKKAINVNPKLGKAHYGLALAYQEMGKHDLLLDEYRVLQDLDPSLAKKLSDTFPEFNLPCGGRRCD